MDNLRNSLRGIVIDISMQIDIEDLAASPVHRRWRTFQRWNMVVFCQLVISLPISVSHSRKDLLVD